MFCSVWLAEAASISRDGPLLWRTQTSTIKTNKCRRTFLFVFRGHSSVTTNITETSTNLTERLLYHIILHPQTVGEGDLEGLDVCVWKQTSLSTQWLLVPEKDRERGKRQMMYIMWNGKLRNIQQYQNNIPSVSVRTASLFRLIFISSIFVSAWPCTERPWM